MDKITHQKKGVYEFFVRLGRLTKGTKTDPQCELGMTNFSFLIIKWSFVN